MTPTTPRLAIIIGLILHIVPIAKSNEIIKDIEFAKIGNHSLKLDLHFPTNKKGDHRRPQRQPVERKIAIDIAHLAGVDEFLL